MIKRVSFARESGPKSSERLSKVGRENFWIFAKFLIEKSSVQIIYLNETMYLLYGGYLRYNQSWK